MKQILVSFIVFAVANAVRFHPEIYRSGVSSQYRSQNELGHYKFGYNEDHVTGGTFRREVSDGNGNVVGAYGLRDIDGRVRVVNYVADREGFRVHLKTNEQGVETRNPSSVKINQHHPLIAQVYPIRTFVPTPVLHKVAPSYVRTFAPTPVLHKVAPSYVRTFAPTPVLHKVAPSYVRTFAPTPVLHKVAPSYAPTYPHRIPTKYIEYYH